MISRQSLVALEHRNFRLIWIGLLVSFTGSSMQNAALLWHVSLLVSRERKGLALGLVGLVRVVPIIVFSMVSGVVADAWDRRRLMLYTQTATALVAVALAVLTFRGLSVLWPIYALAAVGAAVGAFDLPARGALVPTLVPRAHLPNAITLNTVMLQTASVVGPSIGGLLIAAAGVGWAYAVNALSFAFVIVALLMMRDVPGRQPSEAGSRPSTSLRAGPSAGSPLDPARGDPELAEGSERPALRQAHPSTRLGVTLSLSKGQGVPNQPRDERVAGQNDVSLHAALEGLRFVFGSPLIRSTMLLDFFATFFSSATALLPIFAQDILQVGAQGYGWLYAAPAVGALVTSAAMVPFAERIGRRGRALLWTVAGYGLATVVFGMSRSFWLTFACLGLTGAADTVSMVIRNIVRQLETPDRLRGRMIGINMVFFMGGPQLGELEAGAVANWFGAPLSVISGGLGCLLATGWIAATTPALRRYTRGEIAASS